MKLWQGLIVVTLLWAALYLPFLGSNELRGEEARRVLPARTMLQTGDWMVPRIGGEEYSSKPPLINWTIAGVFALTGVESEWTARLPSVLWLLAFALVATGMLAERFGVWRAASVALFFLCSAGLLDKGRMAEIEPMYTAQTGIAYVLWAVWWAEGKLWRAYVAPGIFLGLGLLAKGPVHLLAFYGAVVPALWLARRRIELVQLPHLAGLVLMAAMFLPWMLGNLRQVEAAQETSAIWFDQAAVRFSYDKIDWGEWISLPLEIVKGFLPGALLLVLLWRIPATGKGEARSGDARWRWVIEGGKLALLGGWILLSLSPGFRPRYAMPLFGIASVVLVELMGRLPAGSVWGERLDRWWRRLNRLGLIAVVLGGVAAMVVALGWLNSLALWTFWPDALKRGFERIYELAECISWWHAWPGLLTGLLLAIGWRKMERWPPLAMGCAVFAAAQVLVFQFSRPWEEQRGLFRPVAREVQAMLPDPDRTLVFYRPGFLRFLFYLRRPYGEVTSLSDLPGHELAGYLAVRESDLDAKEVQAVLGRQGAEIGRQEIEGRKFVFFDLGKKR